MSTCAATRKDGQRCRVTGPLDDEGRCVFHSLDPDWREKARAIRERGGRAATSRRREYVPPPDVPPAPGTLEDVKAWQAWVAVGVANGDLTPVRAREILNAITGLRISVEKLDLARELSDLRRQLAELKKKGSG